MKRLAARAATLAILLAGCREAAPPPADDRKQLFALAAPAESRLAAGEVHEYLLGRFEPGEGHDLHLDQKGIDLVVELLDGDGRQILAVDGPSGAWGAEIVCFEARSPGPYRLKIRALDPRQEGSYSISNHEPEAASPKARYRDCENAWRRYAEAAAAAKSAAGPADMLALYEGAIDLWQASQEPFGEALTRKQAGAFAARHGDLDRALHHYQQAIGLLQGMDPAGRHELAAVRNLAGLALNVAGEPAKAREAFELSRELYRQLGDRRGEATTLSNLALAWAYVGELHRAVELHREAIEIWEDLKRQGRNVANEEATSRSVLGGALTQLGRFELALDELRKARELREKEGRPELLATTWLAIGWAEHHAGRDLAAVGSLEKAIELYRQAGSELGEGGAWDRLGSTLASLDRKEEARQAFERSLAVYGKTSDRLHRAHVVANLGCLLLDRRLLGEAAATFETFGDRAAAAHVAWCRARLERQDGNLMAALAASEEALAKVDQLRAAALGQGHPSPTLDLWQRYEQLEVELLMALDAEHPGRGYAARAFERSDLARARHLYEMLLEADVKVRSGVPEELLEQEKEAQRRVNEAELRRQARAEEGSEELRSRLAELGQAQAAIRQASPRFAELRQPAPLRLEEAQALLEPGTVLLSYVLGEEKSWLFLVGRDGLETRALPPRAEIDELAFRVYEGLRSSHQRRVRLQLPALAKKLSQMLLAPVESKLAGHRLLVVGEGLLHYVPFAALPLRSGESEPELLVDRFEVVHLPSVAVMKALRQRELLRVASRKELAVLAAAVYSGPGQEKGEWAELPYTEAEARAILEMVAPEKRFAALGFAANPELVRGGALADYRILHFATHGLLNEENPELSGVALSMWDAEGQPRDGSLRLYEIYALDLPAELVVLSACKTALTPKSQGAGLIGLTQGFFYAGASRLVVSLWDVDDEATAKLMQNFYRGMLQHKLRPPAALRQAQRELKKEERFEAAYYWAGFVLEGDWN